MSRFFWCQFSTLWIALSIVGAHENDEPPSANSLSRPQVDLLRDPLPTGALVRYGTTRFRHHAIAVAILDKNIILSVGSSIRYWSAESGQLIRELRHEKLRSAVLGAISADGSRLATLHKSGAIGLWDLASGDLLREFPSGVLSNASQPRDASPVISISSDGNTIMVATPVNAITDQRAGTLVQICVMGTRYESRQFSIDQDEPEAVSLSPDGRFVVAEFNKNQKQEHTTKSLAVWDTSSARQIRVLNIGATSARRIQFLPGRSAFLVEGEQGLVLKDLDGNELWRRPAKSDYLRLICANQKSIVLHVDLDKTNNFEVWTLDANSGETIHRWKEPDWMLAGLPAFLDESRLVVAYESSIRQLALSDGTEIGFRDGHSGKIEKACASPDGRVVATACLSDSYIILWDSASARELRRLSCGSSIFRDFVFSRDGKLLATASNDHCIRVWDVEAGRVLKTVTLANDREVGIQFLESSARIAIASIQSGVFLHEILAAKPPKAFALASPLECGGLIHGYDGRLWAIFLVRRRVNDDSAVTSGIEIWDVLAKRKLREISLKEGGIVSYSISTDRRTLATCDGDGVITLWELATGLRRLVINARGADRERGGVTLFTFSSDGRTMAVSNTQSSAVSLWDLESSRLFGTVRCQCALITSIEFSPDGKRLLSGLDDTTIIAWDMSRAECLPLASKTVLSEGDVARRWDLLRSADGERAFRSEWELAADPERVVEFLRRRLPNAASISPERAKSWIFELDSSEYSVREHASRNLLSNFDQVKDELTTTLRETTSAEIRKRIQRIIDSCDDIVSQPERLQELRAIEVLERIGTPNAVELLKKLSENRARADISDGAAESLHRIKIRKP